MNMLKLLIFTLIANLFLVSGLFGQEQSFPVYNCAFTPPDGWHVMTNNYPADVKLLADYANATKTRFVILTVKQDNRAKGGINDTFIANFNLGAENAGGGKPLWGKSIDVDGIKSYERFANVIKGKNVISLLTEAVPVDGCIYGLEGIRVDGDASDDPEIQKCLMSFRFLQRPAITTSAQSAAFKAGYFMGRMVVLAFTIIVAVIVLSSVLALRTKRNSALPPPLPRIPK
jgi:hypothetical protein